MFFHGVDFLLRETEVLKGSFKMFLHPNEPPSPRRDVLRAGLAPDHAAAILIQSRQRDSKP